LLQAQNVLSGEKAMNHARLGDRVRAARRARHWTQADLAHEAGTSQGHICDVERGKRPRVATETVVKLATALGVSVAWLAGETEV
jgi:transcriptional regulator with XRE-family HTH domain